MSYNTLAEANLVDAALTQEHLDDAALYLDAKYQWAGKIADITQAANWPRVSHCDEGILTDNNGRELIGIPDQVKKAEIQAAILVKNGDSLLATTVATASSVSATTGGTLIHNEVQAGSVKSIKKYSSDSSESSTGETVQELDNNGFPIIKKIDAILWDIVGKSANKSGFYRRYRS